MLGLINTDYLRHPEQITVTNSCGNVTGIATPAIESWSLGYNADDDITGVTDNLSSSNNQILGYDTLNRLNAGSGNYGSLSYQYDADGNRSSSTINSVLTNYTYATGNRLTKINTTTQNYDADGSLTGDGTYTYSYDDSERLSGVTKAGLTASYLYNGLGQRAEKTVNGTTAVFIYDEAGHLLGEYTPTGGLIAEHIWLNDRPVAVITPTGTYYVHTDQLDTPRYITNASKQLVWDWLSDPFGTSAPNQNPSGLGTFVYNLRMPGQYYDAEAGSNYNQNRFYNASLGRYTESDPVGLYSGINTYTYVLDNPIRYVDPLGLAVDINLFNPVTDPDAWKAANAYQGNPGECTVSGHGNPDFVGGLTPELLARLIRGKASCNGKPVRLLACSTGEKPVDPDRINEGLPYGENLSNDLHRIVWAPETWGWYLPNGSYGVYPTMHNLDYTAGPGAAQQDGPNLNLPGKFIEFGGP